MKTTISTYTMTNEDMTSFANQVKDMLAEIPGHEDLASYTLVAANRNIFGKLWNKFFSENETHLTLHVFQTAKRETSED